MSVLTEEKAKLLAINNNWSPMESKGYVDGEASRRLGNRPSAYGLIGMDEYARGFRAGYYERPLSGNTERAA